MTERRSLVLYLLWVGLIAFGSFFKVPSYKPISKFHLDVVFHFSMYLVLMILGMRPFGYWSFLPTIAVAAGTELGQYFLPYRDMTVKDFITNLCGAAVGFVLWLAVRLIRDRRRPAVTVQAQQRVDS